MKKLYIGNLSYDVTQEEFEKMFSEYGSVSSAVIISDKFTGRPKGFGFVEMENADEADSAIKGLDGKSVQGRNIKVNEARPKKSFSGGGNHRNHRNYRNK